MPMPPPKPTTEGDRDRQIAQEVRQLVRALRANGAQRPEDLRRLVGGEYWDRGRFDRALAFALADGLAVMTAEQTVAAV